jgi:hypothetical protein
VPENARFGTILSQTRAVKSAFRSVLVRTSQVKHGEYEYTICSTIYSQIWPNLFMFRGRCMLKYLFMPQNISTAL